MVLLRKVAARWTWCNADQPGRPPQSEDPMTTIVPPRHEPATHNGAAAPAARDIHTTVTGSPGGMTDAARSTDTGTTARAVARYQPSMLRWQKAASSST